MRRLSEVPPQTEQLRTLMKILRPDVKLYIRDCDVANIVQLITIGKRFERVIKEAERFKPPPNIAQTLFHDTAYVSKKSKSNLQLQSVLKGSVEVQPTTVFKPPSLESSQIKEPKCCSSTVRCWNCGNSGHVFGGCKKPKKKFGHLCGKADTIASACGCSKSRISGNAN
jgi:hypothetical protein